MLTQEQRAQLRERIAIRKRLLSYGEVGDTYIPALWLEDLLDATEPAAPSADAGGA